MRRFLLTMTALVLATASMTAQRRTDQLDRGLIAMKTARGMYLNWRIQADEYYDVSYIVYRDGQPINDKPLSVSNYTDTEGTINSKYTVAAVVHGVVKNVSKVAKTGLPATLRFNSVTRTSRVRLFPTMPPVLMSMVMVNWKSS